MREEKKNLLMLSGGKAEALSQADLSLFFYILYLPPPPPPSQYSVNAAFCTACSATTSLS